MNSKAVAELRRAVTRRFGERVAGGAVVDAIQRWRQRGSAPAASPVTGEVSKGEETVPPPSPRKRPPPDPPAWGGRHEDKVGRPD